MTPMEIEDDITVDEVFEVSIHKHTQTQTQLTNVCACCAGVIECCVRDERGCGKSKEGTSQEVQVDRRDQVWWCSTFIYCVCVCVCVYVCGVCV